MVSDNASSMIYAISTSLLPIREKEEQETDIVNTDYNFESLLFHLPQRESCFAHTLRLAVIDGLKNTSNKLKVVDEKGVFYCLIN